MRSSSRTPPTFEVCCAGALGLIGVLALTVSQALAQSKEAPKASAPARIKVIKVWASDSAEKEEKPKGGDSKKDELKEYRKHLERETHKRFFILEGKVAVEEATPGKKIALQLSQDCKLEITPSLEKKGKEEQLVLQLSLWQKGIEKRSFKARRFDVPLIYCTQIQENGRDLVVIIQKLPVDR